MMLCRDSYRVTAAAAASARDVVGDMRGHMMKMIMTLRVSDDSRARDNVLGVGGAARGAAASDA